MPLSNIVADSSGVLRAKFTIPAGIPAGTKRLRVIGNHGSYGDAFFAGQGESVRETYQKEITVTEERWISPPPPIVYEPPTQTYPPPILIEPVGASTPRLIAHENTAQGGGLAVINLDTGAEMYFPRDMVNPPSAGEVYQQLAGQPAPPGGFNVPVFTFSGDDFVRDPQELVLSPITGTLWQWTCPTGVDPLAQTFMVAASGMLGGVDLWFTAKGEHAVSVQIRGVSNGVPNQQVFAHVSVPVTSIALVGPTSIAFSAPVWINAQQEYALVILADDADAAVAVAELGKYDASAGKWVTEQPYTVGVLLSSSNARTWTAHQDRDLAFRLKMCRHTSTVRMIPLGVTNVTNATDLMLMAYADTYTADTTVRYVLALDGGVSYSVSDGQNVRLSSPYTGPVTISAVMNGTASSSPIFHPGAQLVTGTVATTGTYVSRSVVAVGGNRVKVIFDADIPSGSSVVPSWKGADLGDEWAAVPSVSSRQLDNGFREYSFQATISGEDAVAVKLDLTGTPAARPVVRNLRVYVAQV